MKENEIIDENVVFDENEVIDKEDIVETVETEEPLETAEPNFIINTMLTKEDFKKYLYYSIFVKGKGRILLLVLLSIVLGLIIAFDEMSFHVEIFFIYLPILLLFILIALLVQVERLFRKRIKTDKTGTFDNKYILHFYEDKLVTEHEEGKYRGELEYDKFYRLIETKNYWYFYLTSNQASILSKKNIISSSYDNKIFGEFIKDKFRKEAKG